MFLGMQTSSTKKKKKNKFPFNPGCLLRQVLPDNRTLRCKEQQGQQAQKTVRSTINRTVQSYDLTRHLKTQTQIQCGHILIQITY